MNSGRFMATFEPRRRRIFAVSVLQDQRVQCKNMSVGTRHYRREACMWVGDFLREEQTVAGLRVYGIEVRVCEHPRNTKTWEGCQGVWDLVRFEVFAG